jgi:hypothetical protein
MDGEKKRDERIYNWRPDKSPDSWDWIILEYAPQHLKSSAGL